MCGVAVAGSAGASRPHEARFLCLHPMCKASEKQIALLHLEKALILVLLFIFHVLDPGSLQRHDHGEGSGDRERSRSPGGCSRRELLLQMCLGLDGFAHDDGFAHEMRCLMVKPGSCC